MAGIMLRKILLNQCSTYIYVYDNVYQFKYCYNKIEKKSMLPH